MDNHNPSNIFARMRVVQACHVTEYFPAKTGKHLIILPNFQNCACCKKDLKDNKQNRLHLARKCARIFVLVHCFERVFCSNSKRALQCTISSSPSFPGSMHFALDKGVQRHRLTETSYWQGLTDTLHVKHKHKRFSRDTCLSGHWTTIRFVNYHQMSFRTQRYLDFCESIKQCIYRRSVMSPQV